MTKRYIRLKEFAEDRALFTSEKYLRNVHSCIGDGPFEIRLDQDHFIVSPSKYNNQDSTLIFLGDSFCEQSYIREGFRFTDIIQSRYAQKIRVLNAGYSGMNSVHSINIFFSKILGLKRKSKIFLVYIIPSNDIDALTTPNLFWTLDDQRQSPIVPIRQLDNAQNIKLNFNEWQQRSLVEGVNIIECLSSSCVINNIPFAVCTMPFVSKGYEELPWFKNKYFTSKKYEYLNMLRSSYNASVLDRLSCFPPKLLLDLSSMLSVDNSFFYDEVHLTEKGAQCVAQFFIDMEIPELAAEHEKYLSLYAC